MTSFGAGVACVGVGPVLLALAAAPGWAAGFERAAAEATPTNDVGVLAAALASDCSAGRREIDRARCRGTRSFFDRRLPGRTFVTVVDDPGVVSVSPYESGIQGYRVRLVGCLTCSEPAMVGGDVARFVTLKVPAKGAETMGAGVELARPSVTFKTIEEAQAWAKAVKPNLRAEFVYKPAGTEWSFRTHRGLAFGLVAARIFDRCSGEVLYSEPPSEGRRPVTDDTAGCGEGGGGATKGASGGELPGKLSATQINAALHTAREGISACDEQFKMRGVLSLEFVLNDAGGRAQTVKAAGPLAGTGIARCVLEAVRKVAFPAFQDAVQTFEYPVTLPFR